MAERETVAGAVDNLIAERLRTHRTIRLVVTTGSMETALQPGDRAVIQAVPPSEIRAGDVALAHVRQTWIIHRIVARRLGEDRPHFIAKGDNSLRVDEPWSPEQVVGVVVAVERGKLKINLATGRARWINRTLAWLSRAQCYDDRPGIKWLRKIRRVSLRVLMRLLILIQAGPRASARRRVV